jgi:hypothetical protein
MEENQNIFFIFSGNQVEFGKRDVLSQRNEDGSNQGRLVVLLQGILKGGASLYR